MTELARVGLEALRSLHLAYPAQCAGHDCSVVYGPVSQHEISVCLPVYNQNGPIGFSEGTPSIVPGPI